MFRSLAIAALAIGSTTAFVAAETPNYEVKHISGPRGGHYVVRAERPEVDRPAYALTGEIDRDARPDTPALRFAGPRHNQTWWVRTNSR